TQRSVQGNALAHPALIMLRRHHPNFLGDFGGDGFGDAKSRRINAVVIGQEELAEGFHEGRTSLSGKTGMGRAGPALRRPNPRRRKDYLYALAICQPHSATRPAFLPTSRASR